MWLFLDFDGVLHPEFSYTECFTKVPLVEEVLLPFLGDKKLKIVLSTAWRSSHSLAELQKKFSAEFAKHIVSMTPELPFGFHRGGREKEIYQWLQENAQKNDDWIALDDRKELFSPDCENLYWVNPDVGFTETDAVDLTKKLQNLLSKKH